MEILTKTSFIGVKTSWNYYYGMTYLISSRKVNGDEGQPNYAGCVHSEPNVLGFVESFGYFARQNGIHGADHYES